MGRSWHGLRTLRSTANLQPAPPNTAAGMIRAREGRRRAVITHQERFEPAPPASLAATTTSMQTLWQQLGSGPCAVSLAHTAPSSSVVHQQLARPGVPVALGAVQSHKKRRKHGCAHTGTAVQDGLCRQLDCMFLWRCVSTLLGTKRMLEGAAQSCKKNWPKVWTMCHTTENSHQSMHTHCQVCRVHRPGQQQHAACCQGSYMHIIAQHSTAMAQHC
jgi:hypothetical protein